MWLQYVVDSEMAVTDAAFLCGSQAERLLLAVNILSMLCMTDSTAAVSQHVTSSLTVDQLCAIHWCHCYAPVRQRFQSVLWSLCNAVK